LPASVHRSNFVTFATFFTSIGATPAKSSNLPRQPSYARSTPRTQSRAIARDAASTSQFLRLKTQPSFISKLDIDNRLKSLDKALFLSNGPVVKGECDQDKHAPSTTVSDVIRACYGTFHRQRLHFDDQINSCANTIIAFSFKSSLCNMSAPPPQQQQGGNGQYDNAYGHDNQGYYHDDQAYYDQNNPQQYDQRGQDAYYDEQ
jgi:hypothetical protein